MQRKFLAQLWLVLFFFTSRLQAQTWRQFTKADGLPKDNFNTMAVDQPGNLWIGMPHAISRINGDMVPETYDMAQSGVRLIFESTDSSVWVLTRPGLFRYDQNMDRQYFDQMRWVWFYTMVELNSGDIWSAARGLYGAEYLCHFAAIGFGACC
ncbi:MAG: two-component regulator propeller domain-containing protein [Candidatus Poribacteria bacterium]|nr:two-component regulator propeller domain-containing protein [Candidatus Poribacteria bacterium]